MWNASQTVLPLAATHLIVPLAASKVIFPATASQAVFPAAASHVFFQAAAYLAVVPAGSSHIIVPAAVTHVVLPAATSQAVILSAVSYILIPMAESYFFQVGIAKNGCNWSCLTTTTSARIHIHHGNSSGMLLLLKFFVLLWIWNLIFILILSFSVFLKTNLGHNWSFLTTSITTRTWSWQGNKRGGGNKGISELLSVALSDIIGIYFSIFSLFIIKSRPQLIMFHHHGHHRNIKGMKRYSLPLGICSFALNAFSFSFYTFKLSPFEIKCSCKEKREVSFWKWFSIVTQHSVNNQPAAKQKKQ